PATPAAKPIPEEKFSSQDPFVSIKSFAAFTTPSPKKPRPAATRLAGDRLPSMQCLLDVATAIPSSGSGDDGAVRRRRTRQRLRGRLAPVSGESTSPFEEEVETGKRREVDEGDGDGRQHDDAEEEDCCGRKKSRVRVPSSPPPLAPLADIPGRAERFG